MVKADKNERTILYGITPVHQCLLNQRRRCEQLLVKSGIASKRVGEIVQLARKLRIPIKEVDAHQLANLTQTKMHQGVALDCGSLRTEDLSDYLDRSIVASKRLLVALDQVEDPQNVGAIIRSAAFLGAEALITLRNHSAPLSATVSKASAGALEYLPIIEVSNLSEALQRLKKEGFLVAGATLGDDSVPFRELSTTDYMVLVLGNEGQGLRKLTQKRCDTLIYIPGNESTESLNVSAAGAILIAHLTATY